MSRFTFFFPWCILLIAAVALVGTAQGEDKKGDPMSYGEARAFLAKHTNLIELSNDAGTRVAVAPQWQGRVMTSTCAGLDGPSFGFLNRDYIEAGQYDPRFNNYGPKTGCGSVPKAGRSASGSSRARSK